MVRVLLENTKLLAVGSLATVSGLLLGALWYRKYLKNKPPTKWMKIGEIAELYVYPVKSFKGVVTESFECSPHGAKMGQIRDRSFVVVNKDGKFATGRDYPKMTQLVARVNGDSVILSSPDSSEEIVLDTGKITGEFTKVMIWDSWAAGIDCGDEVAAWISKQLLGTDSGMRMLFCGLEPQGKSVNKRITSYAGLTDIQLQKSDGGFFSDGVSFHLISDASVKELNSRLDGAQVSPLNFRPNLVVKGEMLVPFEEDGWTWLKIGEDVVFQCFAPCTRCLFTTVDPGTGERSEKMEPLVSLRKYRLIRDPAKRKLLASPAMGIYMGLRSPGTVALGDEVFIPQM